MSLSTLLARAQPMLAVRCQSAGFSDLVTASPDACILFFSLCDGEGRSIICRGAGGNFSLAWQDGARRCQTEAARRKLNVRWLRIDQVTAIETLTWSELSVRLSQVKRNYFRFGLALDAELKQAFLEPELGANAMLYPGSDIAESGLNVKNFTVHAQRRFGQKLILDFSPETPVWLFSHEGAFFSNDVALDELPGVKTNPAGLCWLPGPDAQASWRSISSLNAGRRSIEKLQADDVFSLIDSSSNFLARQVKKDGQFIYGHFPCFGRTIPTYNALRHASSTYSMLEAWELTREKTLLAAIRRALDYLVKTLIRRYPQADGHTLAFNVDINGEAKLGANAVSLLALVKYDELTGDTRHRPLMEELALGITHMQDSSSGKFVHVLNAEDLTLKEAFRIVYYDGEAAFGLMRLYGLTHDPRWLVSVEKAFDYFLSSDHWKHHDHWLSYCANELTLYKPEEKYFRFGVKNISGLIDFILQRETTFPTLLELSMAFEAMRRRIENEYPHMTHVLDGLDIEKFHQALHHRAHHLLNGFFWPELAMYFAKPKSVVGSFFIRHHSFRVRIDDIEHYLSGYVAYWKMINDLGEGNNKNNSKKKSNINSEVSLVNDLASVSSLCGPVVAWGGDVNLGRRQHYRTAELGVENVLNIPALREADLSIVNLECVVSNKGEQGTKKGEGGPYYYRARPQMLRVLTSAGVDIVATANNHSGDYGQLALLEQGQLLDAVGIGHAGSGANWEEAFAPVFRRAGNLNIALFSIDATQPRFAAARESAGSAHLSINDAEAWRKEMMPRISAARTKAHIVLVAVHWGKNLAHLPSDEEIAVGHVLIESGADAVLGASAHVLQGIEIYQGRPIIYDAGDLLFDSVRRSLGEGGIFKLELCSSGVKRVNFFPIGIGFGFTEQYQGKESIMACHRFSNKCEEFGTKLTLTKEGSAFIELNPVERAELEVEPAEKTNYQLSFLDNYFYKVGLDCKVDEVPIDAKINPLKFGPLTLIGIKVGPNKVTSRRMLWVESFWRCDSPVEEDLRIGIRGIPIKPTNMRAWGEGMDHDPCDWLLPTTQWESGVIYRDYYGLRPPYLKDWENVDLIMHATVIGREKIWGPVELPSKIVLSIPGKDPIFSSSEDLKIDRKNPEVLILRYLGKPHGLAVINQIANECSINGISVRYATYDNFKIKEGLLQGYVFEKGLWKEKSFLIPQIVCNSPPRTIEHAKVLKLLKNNNVQLTTLGIGGKKEALDRVIKLNPDAAFNIESAVLNYKDLVPFIKKYNRIVLKPIEKSKSSRGAGVWRVSSDRSDEYCFEDDQQQFMVRASELEVFVREKFQMKYMMQRYIASCDTEGRPFDVRVPVMRISDDEWVIPRIYVRRSSNRITSNLATGGEALDARDFFVSMFSESDAERILLQLASYGRHIAQSMQTQYDYEIDALGCDFGIEEDGIPKLFEVNAYPGMKGFIQEAARARVRYYRYLLEKKNYISSEISKSFLRNERIKLFEAATSENGSILRRVMDRGENDYSQLSFIKFDPEDSISSIIFHDLRQRGLIVKRVKKNHIEIFDGGRCIGIFSMHTPNQMLTSIKVSKDKNVARRILAGAGINVPVGKTFSDLERGLAYFRERKSKLVLKPIKGSNGVGVTVGVEEEVGFIKAWHKALEAAPDRAKKVVIEDFIVGDKVKLVVLDGDLTAAYCCVPAYVIGDGRSSIGQLVSAKNLQRLKNPIMCRWLIDSFEYLLKVACGSLDDIPKADEYVRLSIDSNIQSGGEAVHLLDELHPSFFDLGINVFNTIPGATQIEIDVIAKDFSSEVLNGNAVVVGINSSPILDIPYFAAWGISSINIANKLIDFLERNSKSNISKEKILNNSKFKPASIYKPTCGGESFPRTYDSQMRIIRRAAYIRGVSVDKVDPVTTILRYEGSSFLFHEGMSSGLLAASRRISNHKEWTKKNLKEYCVNTPEGGIFSSKELNESWEFASKIGLPVVIKPLSGSGGRGISTHINDRNHYDSAWDYATSTGASKIIVESCHDGNDYRVIVIGQSLVAAIQRIPAHVTGDGIHSIEELVKIKNTLRKVNPNAGDKPIVLTPPILLNLYKSGLNSLSILPAGQRVLLQLVANIGSGGEGVDVTEQVHPDWAEIAVQARRAVFNAPHIGLDLIAEDIALSPNQQRWVAIEVNTNPGLGANHFPMHGQGRDVAGALVDHLFGLQATPQQTAMLLTINGKVQGVGYRKWAWREAHLRALDGWVCNSSDGTVKILLAGAKSAVEDMLKVCRKGPSKARVSMISCDPWLDALPSGFEIIFKKSNEKIS